jgi:hypothetical protein
MLNIYIEYAAAKHGQLGKTDSSISSLPVRVLIRNPAEIEHFSSLPWQPYTDDKKMPVLPLRQLEILYYFYIEIYIEIKLF